MGRVSKKKVNQKKRAKTTNSPLVNNKNKYKRKLTTKKPNENLMPTIEALEIENNSTPNKVSENMNTNSSEVTVSNILDNSIIDITDITINGSENENNQKPSTSNIEVDEIIDITNITFVESKANEKMAISNIKNDEIIDITDTTIIDTNEHENIQSESSDDDVQFISHITNEPVEIVTISDDSDEEMTPNIMSVMKPKDCIPIKDLKKVPIHERLGISTNSTNLLKRSYCSPLRHRKKVLKGDNASKDNCLLDNLGPFVIDKQKISHRSQRRFEPNPTASFPQQYKPPSVPTLNTNRKLRPIIIDGLNIGHAHGSGTFSVKGIELCIKYFAKRGHDEIIAFIPQHRQGPPGSESNTVLNELFKKGHICFTPSRKVQNLRMTCYDDRIILKYAHNCHGVVVSNDNYRDLYDEDEAFKDIIENRQVMVTFVRDEIIVPDDQYNRRSCVRSLSDILCFQT